MSTREVITRRQLPHWYVPGAAHFVTFRLYGTLPQTVLDDLRTRKEILLQRQPKPGVTSAQQRMTIHKQLFAHYDAWLDRGGMIQWLAEPRVAALVRSSLYYLHDRKYHLLAFCILSNHVHVLFQPREGTTPEGTSAQEMAVGEDADRTSPLSEILHSLKSYTAHEANKILGRTGSFWQGESYDHWVRDDEELERIVTYICDNPVKAGLVERPHDWFYSSAHDRFLTDGECAGWLYWQPSPRSAGVSPAQ